MRFLSFLFALLGAFGISSASFLDTTLELHGDLIEGSSNHTKEPSRLVMYVQTFTTPHGEPLSLLPLLHHRTKVTHVILASIHLHEKPGEIRLNDDPFDSSKWGRIWQEVRILQVRGIKVMGLLGGAAGGTYKNLNGTEKEVSFQSLKSIAI